MSLVRSAGEWRRTGARSDSRSYRAGRKDIGGA